MITRVAHPSLNAAISAPRIERPVPALRVVASKRPPQSPVSTQFTFPSGPIAAGLFGSKLSIDRVLLSHVQHVVSAYFNLPRIEMISDRRGRDIARPRQISMYICSRLTPLSKVEIGRRHGGRDHTTVIHACRQIEKLRETEEQVERAVRILEQELAR